MNKILYRMVLVVLLALPGSYSIAQESIEQDSCGSNAIVTATYQYEIGRFNECIASLKHCLDNDGFDYSSKIQAYKLSAMCYLALDSVNEANRSIERLLTIDDNFAAEILDPQRFKLQVVYIRTQMRANLTSSVSKKMENIEMAPATIQIITAKDIENRGYADIESIFSDLPGFDVTRNFGISYSVLYQRGYRSPALTERTMILVDGIEDNDLWTNAAFITKQYPVSSVKRVEVIYGPASTIYGANAYCGVINIVTKEEDDLFAASSLGGSLTPRESGVGEKPKNVAVNLQSGVASYNTRYVDGTIGLRNKEVVLTVTGRVYMSDGIDQSADPNWDGVPNYGSAAYTTRMSMKYSADNATKYIGEYFKVSSDSTKIVPTTAGIARADSFDKALYKTSRKNSGQFSDPILDFYVAAKLTVHNFKFGFQYWNKNEGAAGDYVDKYASPNSNYTNWQVRAYNVSARYDKKLTERMNFTSLTYYRYCDFGNNSRVALFSGYGNGGLNDSMFMKGVLPRFNSTNYYEASNLLGSQMRSSYVISDKFDVLAGGEFRTGILQADYIKSSVSPAIVYGKPSGDSAGGNNFTTYTISGFLTTSFHDAVHKINVDLGGRVDYNGFRLHQGYGTVFNPRVDFVYYPGRFIFKAIYAEAFLDASNQNKFGTVTSRLLNNPSVPPERVKNLEFTVRYKFRKRSYVEVSRYQTNYSHTLQLAPYPLPGYPNNVRYMDIGKSEVTGFQAASEIFAGEHVSIYSNFTTNDAVSIFTNVSKEDSVVRTGDIAYVSANAGVNLSFFRQKINLNTRVNVVGDKPTGKNTSVSANPSSKIPAFYLLNATLGYRIIKSVLLQVTCNNILDAKYYSPGVRTAEGTIYAPTVIQPGRNYLARLIVDLKK